MIKLTQKEMRETILDIIPFKMSSEEYVGSAAILERYVMSRTGPDGQGDLPTENLMRARLSVLKRVYLQNHSAVEAVRWARAAEAYMDEEDTKEWKRLQQGDTPPAPPPPEPKTRKKVEREL